MLGRAVISCIINCYFFVTVMKTTTDCILLLLFISRFSLPVAVRFTPKWEKEVNFNVVCNVKRKMVPLTLNVKAEGYSMNCLVLCDDSAGNKVELSSNCRSQVNFGRVSYQCCYFTNSRMLHSSVGFVTRLFLLAE